MEEFLILPQPTGVVLAAFVLAFVVTKVPVSNNEILGVVREVCKDRLIPYAIPVGVACISESDIERTALGKVVWGKLEKKALNFMNEKQ